MKEFMGKDFLLENETAKHLYHDFAENMPIVDYHCHIPQREIYENRRFENIAQVWLGGHMVDANGKDYYFGDHYKWRLMRACGVAEEYITGDKPDEERFQKFAESLEKAIGNPMVHWCQLELKKYFGYEKMLNSKTWKEVWDLCNDKLQNDDGLTVRGLIDQSNVAFIGTTDDPIDDLHYHDLLQHDRTITYRVAPSFRPDKAYNIHLNGFKQYIEQLGSVAEVEIKTAADVAAALEKRVEFFVSLGCKASDHGVAYIPEAKLDYTAANEAFQKVMNGEEITLSQQESYQYWLICQLGKMYYKNDVVMQIHYNALRNTNTKYFNKLGPDTGLDMMDSLDSTHGIVNLLNQLMMEDSLPKTILYSLNSKDFDMLATLAGCFQQDSPVASRVQVGSAWWFLDTRDGMEQQLKTFARIGTLGNFIGMLTDSRSFLSYTRHEYFRRILCNIIGKWVENGEFPNDDDLLRPIVEGICFNNAAKYFSMI